MRYLTILFLFSAMLHGSAYAQDARTPKTAQFPHGPWPEILPAKVEYTFQNVRKIGVLFYIVGLDRQRLYKLECHGAGDGANTEYFALTTCYLQTLQNVSHYQTLLTMKEDIDNGWYTRAKFYGNELEGDCENYPEYGGMRTFRLRGMKLTLAFKDFKRNHDLLSTRLIVEAVPDPSAQTQTAEEDIPYLPPAGLKEPETPEEKISTFLSERFGVGHLDCSKVLMRSDADPKQEKK